VPVTAGPRPNRLPQAASGRRSADLSVRPIRDRLK